MGQRSALCAAGGSERGERDIPPPLAGSTLMVEEKPFFPRAIQWNGESLKFLVERGFNTVQLATVPQTEQVDEAKRTWAVVYLCAAAAGGDCEQWIRR